MTFNPRMREIIPKRPYVLKEEKIHSTALLVACQKCRTSTFKVIKNEINQKSKIFENNSKFEEMVQRFQVQVAEKWKII